MPRLTFRMDEAFPAEDPIGLWVMNLSIALGDMRIAMKYAVREDQSEHERFYFVRIVASHLREVAKVIVLDHRKRQDVRDFVASLPQEAQDARSEVERLFEGTHTLRSSVTLFEDMKRIRDDTFHYASDRPSIDRLRGTVQDVADMEGVYALDGEELRAEYADLVVANRMHPYGDDDHELHAFMREMHAAIISLNGEVAKFIAQVEAHYLLDRLPSTVVTRHP